MLFIHRIPCPCRRLCIAFPTKSMSASTIAFVGNLYFRRRPFLSTSMSAKPYRTLSVFRKHLSLISHHSLPDCATSGPPSSRSSSTGSTGSTGSAESTAGTASSGTASAAFAHQPDGVGHLRDRDARRRVFFVLGVHQGALQLGLAL